MKVASLFASRFQHPRLTSASLDKQPRHPSPLSAFNLKAFLVPALIIIAGIILLYIVLTYTPQNFSLILWAEIIIMIGLSVAFLMGIWVMTLVRVPGKEFHR